MITLIVALLAGLSCGWIGYQVGFSNGYIEAIVYRTQMEKRKP